MIIYNFKINKKVIIKIIVCLMILIALSISIISLYSMLNKIEKKETNYIKDMVPENNVAKILPENYTNVLKEVHENIDNYVGQKISFSEYIYRVNDFSDNQFVLARDMDIGNKQTLIVGFLCSCDFAKEFDTYSWVEIEGEITKGTYNNQDIPIIEITKIEKAEKPENPNVPIPDDAYVPTATIY